MLKILVIDDSAVMRMMMKKALRDAGYENFEMTEAGGGIEGQELALNQTFDLVLCDVNMPDQSGIETLKTINAKLPHLPVVMVTTESGDKQVAEMKENGAKAIIFKPFEPEELQSIFMQLKIAA